MRFGGFTEKQRTKAVMDMFKEQRVFDINGQICPYKIEAIPSFTGRYVSSASMTDIYLRGLSIEKQKITPWMLVGVTKSSFEIDENAVLNLIDESKKFWSNKSYLRWHDVIVMTLILQYYSKTKHGQDARDAITNLSMSSDDLLVEMKKFTEQRWQ